LSGDADVDVEMDGGESDRGDGGLMPSTPLTMSPDEMRAHGRKSEARFEALIRRNGGGGVEVHGARPGDGLEFGSSSEVRDFARFRMVL